VDFVCGLPFQQSLSPRPGFSAALALQMLLYRAGPSRRHLASATTKGQRLKVMAPQSMLVEPCEDNQ
jgi:hypothetical protein